MIKREINTSQAEHGMPLEWVAAMDLTGVPWMQSVSTN